MMLLGLRDSFAECLVPKVFVCEQSIFLLQAALKEGVQDDLISSDPLGGFQSVVGLVWFRCPHSGQ